MLRGRVQLDSPPQHASVYGRISSVPRIGLERLRTPSVRATSRRLDASRTPRGDWSNASTFRPCTAPWHRSGPCCWHVRRTAPAPVHGESLQPGSAPAEQASSTRRAPWTYDASGRAPASPRARERLACLSARQPYAAPLLPPSSRLSFRPSSRPWPHWRSASPPSCQRRHARCRLRARWWRWSCHPCIP
jgi:hypothetical protein